PNNGCAERAARTQAEQRAAQVEQQLEKLLAQLQHRGIDLDAPEPESGP
ncbi:MAG: hypothetical protein HC884_19615, partial [Chloroflexaceae bacterium]|nr:hypothetical protein [Chloroflexaceae bacterium]